MSEVRATDPAGRADERHADAAERRARAETRAADRARSEEYVEGQRDQRRHDRAVASRRRAPAARSARRTATRVKRSAVAPVTTAATSAAGLFGIALSLVALYLVLTSAETVAKVLHLVRGGLHWLSSPKKSIPYGGDGKGS